MDHRFHITLITLLWSFFRSSLLISIGLMIGFNPLAYAQTDPIPSATPHQVWFFTPQKKLTTALALCQVRNQNGSDYPSHVSFDPNYPTQLTLTDPTSILSFEVDFNVSSFGLQSP